MKNFIIIVLLNLLIFPIFSQSDMNSYTEWVAIKPIRLLEWEIIEYPDIPLMVTIQNDTFSDPANKKDVLILFPKKSSAYDTALDKILQLFEEKGISVEFTIINFLGDAALGLEALSHARINNMDLIFSMGSTSTEFIVEQYSGGAIPVVSICSKDPVLQGWKEDGNYETGTGNNIAFTSLNVSAELHINYLLDLIPNLENIAIMYRQGNSSAVTTQVLPMEKIAEEYGIIIIHIAVQNKDTAAEELEILVPQAVEEIKRLDPDASKSIFWITGSTSVFNEIETINMYSENVPVLSIPRERVVQEGENSAVLSIGVGFESNAHLAALYGIGILTGEYTAGELPVGIITPPDIAINFLKARQIGLRIPFKFFESANFIYDYAGNLVRGSD